MFFYAVIYSLITASTNAINSTISKIASVKDGYKEAVFYNAVFSSFFVFIPAVMKWQYKLSFASVSMSLLLGIIQMVTLTIYSSVVTRRGTYSLSAIEKIMIILMLTIDVITKNVNLNIYIFIGVVLYLTSLVSLLLSKSEKSIDTANTKDRLTMDFILYGLAILLWTIKPFILKYAFKNHMFNNQSYIFVNFVLLAFFSFFILKPKIIINKSIFKNYSLLGVTKTTTSFFYNKALMIGSVSIIQIIVSLDIILTAIMSSLVLKTKVKISEYILMILCFIGICIIILNK